MPEKVEAATVPKTSNRIRLNKDRNQITSR